MVMIPAVHPLILLMSIFIGFYDAQFHQSRYAFLERKYHRLNTSVSGYGKEFLRRMLAMTAPIEIFCSYAQEDEFWFQKLEVHLRLLQRQGLISLWHKRLITPGTDQVQDIDAHLETASIFLLLVSADFFASDYCYGVEMQRAFARQEAEEARVIPILLRPSDYSNSPLARLQVLPMNKKPLALWQDKDAAFADVTTSLRHVITEELPLTDRISRAAFS